jgi:outer membrane murein-binding lipoprotein Lpp
MKKFTLACIILLVLLSGCSQNELDALNEQIATLNQEKETLISENKEVVEDLELQVEALTQQLEEANLFRELSEVRGVKKHAVKTTVDMRRLEVEGLPFILEYQDFTQEKLFFYASPKGLDVAYYNDRPNEALRIEVFASVHVLTTAELNQIRSDESSNTVKVLKNLNNGMVVGLIIPVGGIEGMWTGNVEVLIHDTMKSFIAK